MYSNYNANITRKATLCHKNNCVTVFGDAAIIVNIIVVIAALVTVMSIVTKTIK